MTDVTPEGLDAVERCVERDTRRRVYADSPSVIFDTIRARATLAAMRAMLAERMPAKLQTCDIEACIAHCTEGPASPFVPVAKAQLAALLAENARLRRAAEGIDTFAWSAMTADCEEARVEAMKRIGAVRAALAEPPG